MSLSRIHYLILSAILAASAVALAAFVPVSPVTQAAHPVTQANPGVVQGIGLGNPKIKIRIPLSPLVRGFVVAYAGGRQEVTAAVLPSPLQKKIYLPGIKLVLDNVTTHTQGPPVVTDLSGRFTLRAPGAGTYRICWSSPIYGTGCTVANWTIGTRPLYISSIPLVIPYKKGMAALYGHVTDLEGGSVRTYQPYFNVNAFARVGVESTSGPAFKSLVFVNNLGDYLVPYAPINQRLTVLAVVEKGRATQDIIPGVTLADGSYDELNLKIGNHPPKLSPLAAGDGAGNRVQSAHVGDEVYVTAPARDDDPGDTIGYRWYVSEGDGTLSQLTGPGVKWKLPSTPGRYTISVVAYDEHGGYDLGSLSLLADGNGVPFSGHVVTTFGAPIANATITVVGNTPVTTNASGYFVTRVATANRYVFNARATNYALNSQIYDHGVTGGRWILHSAEPVTFDPTKPNTVTNQRNERDCVGPASWTARTGPAGNSIRIPQYQDGRGHVIDPPGDAKERIILTNGLANARFKLLPCRPGVSVSLPANAIVDAQGHVVTTPVTAYISTVDLASPQQMPGDDGVKKLAGGGAALESFGAGAFDLPPGMKLRPGTKAKVTIPVDRLPLSGGVTPPPTIPLLSYDETGGLWTEEGTLTLQTIAGIPTYVGAVSHFSTFNSDNVKDDSSACIRLFSQSLPPKYNLEVSAPYHGTGAPKIVSHVIDQTDGNENVLYNLPNNVNVTMTATTLGNPSSVLGTFIVNSGNAANPNTSPLAPNYVVDNAHPGDLTKNGYIACTATVNGVTSGNFVVIKPGNAPGTPIGGEFLHGLGVLDAENLGFTDLTGAGPTGNALIDAVVAASTAYYTKVDPNNLRTNFHDFKTQDGFAQDASQGLASGEYVAQYANSGDLGFGRDMHCRVTDV
ncbi:MAG TPA: carboxypeptidase-like regulatory domain-containing protein, partial [Rhizomicrobium sp.]|nr:carboxypeptidase-like regulatory domain-containing protein [Rhizomicrobium sp.]